MDAGQIAVFKTGLWATFAAAGDSVCGAWELDVTGLYRDAGWSANTVAMADGTVRVYRPSRTSWRASIRGTVFSDHLPNGTAAVGSVAALRANMASLRTVMATGRTSGDGRLSVALKETASGTAVQTVKVTVTGVEFGEWGGYPAEAPVTIAVEVAADGA